MVLLLNNTKNWYAIKSSSSSCRAGYHWPSLATSPYRSSPLAGLQGYILYPHRAAVCMFELVTLLLLGHMWGVHRSTSLMSSFLLLQLTWIVFVMGGRWPYSWCFVGCCLQDLFSIVRNILSNVSSTEKDIDTRLTKAWTVIDKLPIIWKSDLTDKMKPSFFQAAVVSILLYGCTTWTQTKRLEKKLDGNYTRMPLNKRN